MAKRSNRFGWALSIACVLALGSACVDETTSVDDAPSGPGPAPTGSAPTGGDPPGAPGAPAPGQAIDSVTVSPNEAALVVGQSSTHSVEIRDAQGNAVTGASVAWSSSDPAIASVTATGALSARIDGVAPGTATVRATVDGKQADVAVAVTASDSPAPPSKPAWFEFDPSTFKDTATLRAACSSFDNCIEDLGIQNIFFDSTTGYDGRKGAMRYDWTNQGCNSRSVGRALRLPSKVTEVWVEFAIRWSTNFLSYNAKCPPGAHKLFFGSVTPDLNGRWAIHWGQQSPPLGISAEWAGNLGDTPQFHNGQQYWDGNWHVVRVHWKHSTNSTSKDGRYQMWIDGKKVYDNTTLSTPTGTAIHSLALGRNKDKGLDTGTESLWWGLVRAWNTDPGW